MATIKKGVILKFGIVTAIIDVTSALQPRTNNITVCQGANDNEPHAPAPVRTKLTCIACGDIYQTDIHKARRVGNGIVVLDNDDITTQAEIVTDEQKTTMPLTPTQTSDMLAASVNGAKVYYLKPQPGNSDAYHAILGMVTANPDLAFMTEWAPRTQLATFRIGTRNNVLTAEERTPAENLQEPPVIPEPSAQVPAYVKELNRSVSRKGCIVPFTTTATEDIIAKLVLTRTPVPEYMSAGRQSVSSSDTQMEEMFAQLQKANKGVRTRKVKA